jgi:hypothetical protein
MKLALLVATLVMSACSNNTVPPIEAGGPTGYGGGCPSTAPPPSGNCTNEGTECEYAGQLEFCGNVLQCTSGQYVPQIGYCGTPDITGNLCAKTLSGVPVGTSCPQIVQCDFTGGRCSCSNQVDGGLTDGGFTWSCTHTPPGCPSKRPLLGMNCAPEGKSCDYGACTVEDTSFASPLALRCTGGIWVRAGCGG